MIVYFRCLCRSRDKLYAKQLAKEGYEIRITKKNPVWAKEAKAYGKTLPIIVENGHARTL